MLSCQIVQAIDSMFHVSELVVATGWATKWFVANCHGRTIQNALGDFQLIFPNLPPVPI